MILNIGTKAIYRPVIKAAFPAVVYSKPICCKDAPRKRAHPVMIPANKAPEEIIGLFSLFFESPVSFGVLFKYSNKGINEAPPRANLTPLKVKGPTY
jgi:hypothetical protein